MRYTLAVVVLIWTISGGSVFAMIPKEADARLEISYEESGRRTVGMVFRHNKSDIEALRARVAEWFGVPLADVIAVEDVEEYPLALLARGQLERDPPLVFSDSLDMNVLSRILEMVGVDTVQLVVTMPPSPLARFGDNVLINMLGVMRYEKIMPASQIAGIAPIQFGWRYRDLVIYIATPVLFLLAFELTLRRVRRHTLLVERRNRPAAIFMCGRIHHLASLLFLVLWPGLILMLVPMGYVLFVPSEFYTAALMARIFLPILLAFLYIIWIRVALYPVFQHFPEPSWSRRELLAQGAVVGILCLILLPCFGLSVLMLVFKPEMSTDILLVATIAAVLSPALVILLYSRLVQSVVRTPESSPERKRLDELTRKFGFGDAPRLHVFYYPRTSLTRALEAYLSVSVLRERTLRGIPVSDRLLRVLLPDELDAMLLSEVDKSTKSYWRNVSVVRAATKLLLFPGLLFIVLGILVLVGESDGVRYLYNGWVLFAAVYLIPSAILLAGRNVEMRLVRRGTWETDGIVLEQLGDPEAQIRAILRDAYVNYTPLEVHPWLRPVSKPSPMERVRDLAGRSGIPADRIGALREYIESTTGLAIEESDANSTIATNVDGLLIRSNLSRTLPVFGFAFAPIVIPWVFQTVAADPVSWWLWLPAATVIYMLAVLGIQNVALGAGKCRLLKTLGEYIPLPEASAEAALPVEFGPVQRVTDTRGFAARSAGFLFWLDDTLCCRNYEGDVVIDAREIENLSIRLDPIGLYPAFELLLSWRESYALKEYQVRLLTPGSVHRTNLETLVCCEQLWDWWTSARRCESEQKQTDDAGAVDRTPRWTPTVRTKEVTLSLIAAGAFIAMLGLYTGWDNKQPMNWSDANSAFWGPAIAVVSTVLIVLFQQGYVAWVVRRFRKPEG